MESQDWAKCPYCGGTPALRGSDFHGGVLMMCCKRAVKNFTPCGDLDNLIENWNKFCENINRT